MTQARQRLNRACVVEMAAHIADAEGLDAVTLSRIAADAGVKQPALYRHVIQDRLLLRNSAEAYAIQPKIRPAWMGAQAA